MTEEAKQQGDCGPRVEAASTRFCSVHDGQPASQAKRGSSEQQIKILVFKYKTNEKAEENTESIHSLGT